MKDYFYGWYFKCQSDAQTLAMIPAMHRIGNTHTCSIQIITKEETWNLPFPGDIFYQTKENIFIGENRFGEKGIRLAIHTPEVSVKGHLKFGQISPLKYDIMGPFAFVPFMECRHHVFSMKHTVNGKVFINGKQYVFENAYGYWEGDEGRSFPSGYLWTQAQLPQGALMLSVADIPIMGVHFMGIIGVVFWKGKEYRLATYLGAKAAELKDRRVRIVQKNLQLEAYLSETAERPLKAPKNGTMERTIHESVVGRVFYRFKKGKQILFDLETNAASFEYEMEQ